MLKFYISTPIYYVNDKPHIGHAYTTIAADVLARYHRQKGDEVFFLTGTDEHGAKIAEAAAKAGKEPQDFCDGIAFEFQETWRRLNISNDKFIRTTDEEHVRAVQKFVTTLKKSDSLYEKEYSGLYCTGCEKFLTEKELAGGKCLDHNQEPEKVKERNWFFKLSEYLPKVKKLIKSDEVKVGPAHIKKEVLGLIDKQELPDFSFSRQKVAWGIELPWDKSQTVYVWADALPNYISAIGYENNQKEFKKWWEKSDITHLLAKDILKFHAIYWPAMLLAAGLKLPNTIFAHGFFTINGQKMSKTLGNVIDPIDLVSKFGIDATRYLLLSQFPFGQDGDIDEKRFSEKYNADLTNGLGNLVSRVLGMTNGVVSEKPTNEEELIIPHNIVNFPIPWAVDGGEPKIPTVQDYVINEIWKDININYSRISLDGVLKDIIFFINTMNGYINYYQLFTLLKKGNKKGGWILYNTLEALRHLAWMIRPFMPVVSDKILEGLCCGQEAKELQKGKIEFDDIIKWGRLKSGGRIKKGKILFPKIK